MTNSIINRGTRTRVLRTVVIAAALVSTLVVSSFGARASLGSVTLMYNDRVVDLSLPPAERNGLLFFPLKDVLDAVTGGHSWNPDSQVISAELNGNTVSVSLADMSYAVNGSTLVVPEEHRPFTEEMRLFVLLDYITDGLGLDMLWNGMSQTVYIFSNFDTPVLSQSVLLPLPGLDKTADSSPGITSANIVVNGEISAIELIEVPGEDGTIRVFADVSALFNAVDAAISANYNESSHTLEIMFEATD